MTGIIFPHNGLIKKKKAAAGGGFLPSDIASLESWHSADSLTYSDAAGSTPQSTDAGSVRHWGDKTGNGYNWKQTSGNAPTLRTSVVNGEPVIRFSYSGTQAFLDGLNYSALTEGEIFAVHKFDGIAIRSSPWFMFTYVDEEYIPFSDGKIYSGWGSSARKSPDVPPSSVSSFHVINIWSATNDWSYRMNNTIVRASATNTVGFVSNCNLGRGRGTGAWSGMDMAEICVFNAKLSSGDRADMLTYLGDKYSITIA